MIVVTGATGRTGRRVAEILLQTDQKVRAIGRDANKLAPLAQQGAELAVGNLADLNYLTKALAGANAAYLVLPEDLSQPDLRAHQDRISDLFAAAILQARVPFAVNLSSIGAQHTNGTGPIVGLHNQEQKLNRIAGLNVLHLRAAYFMENLFFSLAPLRTSGTLPGAMPADAPMPWIATKDIADYAAARLIARDFSARSVQELHGQRDVSMHEAARIVGQAIGKPVAYAQLPTTVLESAMLNMGLPKMTAALITEMWNGANSGLMVPQEPRSPQNTTPTTLESFVAEVFAPAFLNG
jgi:uncharacterized protein YbjT (DUF2867 family)